MENTQERSVIVQYEDRVVRMGVDGTKGVDLALVSSVNKNFNVLCESKDMIQVNMVRGVLKKVFFAKKAGQSDKIFMVSHGNQKGEIENDEAYQLTAGRLVAFEPDYVTMRDMRKKNMKQVVQQAFYILSDQQQLLHIQSSDEIKFRQLRSFDLSHYQLTIQLQAIKEHPW